MEMYGRKVKASTDRLGDRWSDRWSDKWSEMLNINPSAIQKDIEALKKLDVIKRIGSAKNGHWEVIKKTKAIKG